MKILIIASIIAASTAAHADMSNLLKLREGVALGKQALDAAKVLQPAQPVQTAESAPIKRTVPASGSIEQMCITALNNEQNAIRIANVTESELKTREAGLEILKLQQKLSPAFDQALKNAPHWISEKSKEFDSHIAEVSRSKLNRERICLGLLN